MTKRSASARRANNDRGEQRINKKLAAGAAGALVGAVVAGPVGAVLGGVAGTLLVPERGQPVSKQALRRATTPKRVSARVSKTRSAQSRRAKHKPKKRDRGVKTLGGTRMRRKRTRA